MKIETRYFPALCSGVFLLFLITGPLVSSPAAADDQQAEPLSESLEQGIGAYKHENFEEALPLLKKARAEAPDSTLAAYYLGINYKQLEKHEEAIPHLRAAVTGSPKIIGALIELIDCLYQVNELEEAHKWIKEARREGIRPAQVAFLRGLVLLNEDKNEEAIRSFEEAKERDKMMTQSADYQIGIAHLKEREYDSAHDIFKNVVTLDPSSNMALYANEYIDAISRRAKAMRPWRYSLGIFYQQDDNVVLKPSDEAVAANIAETRDAREVYVSNLEYNHRFDEEHSLKAQHILSFAKQHDLGFYDTLSNTVVLQPNFVSENKLLALPFTYTHSIVDDRSYLSSASVSGVCNFMHGRSQMGQAQLKYTNNNYLWTPSTTHEDRDGNELSGSAGWYWFFAKRKGFFNLRYTLNQEWTQGKNWEYTGNRINATTLVPLNEKLNFTFTAGTFFQRFANSHTVYNIKRRDNVYSLTSLLAYKIFEDSELQVQYTHITDDSNISVYDYDRNIYSIGMQFKI